jgi:hypothetical protein
MSILVAVLLLGILGYFLLIKPALNSYTIKQQTNAVNLGVNYGISYGVNMTIAYLMQQALTCPLEGVPVYAGNITLHMIPIECLRSTTEINLK